MKTNGYITVNREVAKLLPNKTMTRRVIKDTILDMLYKNSNDIDNKLENILIREYIKYNIGDILWIREPAKINTITYNDTVIVEYSNNKVSKQIAIRKEHLKNPPIWYKVDSFIPNGCLKEMARYFVKITNVRVERLQEITFEDIVKEGYVGKVETLYRDSRLSDKAITGHISNYNDIIEWFIKLWNTTAPKGYKWKDNPFVFVCEWEYVK